MAVEVKIPELGESITEVVLTTWHKQNGEWVDKDEDLFEVESDKITTDIPSPESGVISLSVDGGAELEVGAIVATIDPTAEKPSGTAAAATPEPAVVAAAKTVTDSMGTPRAPENPVASVGNGSVRSTPVARRMADDQGIDLGGVNGTGPGGRITKQDVLKVGQVPDLSKNPPAGSESPTSLHHGSDNRATRTEKMSRLRQRIAERLVFAKNSTAMLTTFNECDMAAVMALRKKYKESFAERYGVGLGFMSFFVKACTSALALFPRANAYVVDDSIEYHDFVDLSVAVSTEKGLTVPILRNAEVLSFAGIEAGIKDLAIRARDGQLTMDDLTGGTFTITNGGVFGSLQSTPILNPPQSAILGMHTIQKRPVEDPANPGQITLRPMMYLALSYDHRIVDGKEAVAFLVHVKQCIEDPQRLMLDL